MATCCGYIAINSDSKNIVDGHVSIHVYDEVPFIMNYKEHCS